MFLIEYSKGEFVDAEKIDCVDIVDGCVIFGVHGTPGVNYVTEDLTPTFINNLSALDGNGAFKNAGKELQGGVLDE